jgi:hypothetical protein
MIAAPAWLPPRYSAGQLQSEDAWSVRKSKSVSRSEASTKAIENVPTCKQQQNLSRSFVLRLIIPLQVNPAEYAYAALLACVFPCNLQPTVYNFAFFGAFFSHCNASAYSSSNSFLNILTVCGLLSLSVGVSSSFSILNGSTNKLIFLTLS